jgi:hypothetical protein
MQKAVAAEVARMRTTVRKSQPYFAAWRHKPIGKIDVLAAKYKKTAAGTISPRAPESRDEPRIL